jgi:hypothetical protein
MKMSTAHVFTPENRLAKILDSLGGTTPEDMISDADRRVAEMTGAIQQFVAEKVTLILPFADQEDDVLFAECRTLAGLAIQVAEVAGAARLKAVGDIAGAIASMIERLVTHGVWHGEALRVHIRALTIVSQTPGRAAEDDNLILENLRRMRAAIGFGE